jgi:hypothetical protein
MSTKTKSSKMPLDQLGEIAAQAGLILMTAAVTLGMLELPDHTNGKIILPGQPSFAFAGDNEEANNPIRREREESAPHFISYSEVQRTPSRSGRQ